MPSQSQYKNQPAESERTLFEQKPLRVHPITWRALDTIRPHESSNPNDLEAFCRSLREMGLFYKPILIDGESGTILDGTHRWAGLREMDATKAPVIEFEYLNNDEITVDTWLPVHSISHEKILSFLDNKDIEYSTINETDGRFSIEKPVLKTENGEYSIQEDPITLFHDLESNWSFQYVQTEGQLHSHVQRGGCGFLRTPPDKETVVQVARQKDSVPPKYTRHEFPFKYQHIMVQLEELIP
ncbi:MAG: ParB N-terminal domain-containing protein [bacterium]